MAYYTLADLLSTHALLPGWRMDCEFSRYLGWTVEEIDKLYWLVDPAPGAIQKVQGPYDTEDDAWRHCPKWSRDGHLTVGNIIQMVMATERELTFHGDLHVFYDQDGVLQYVSRMRWRYQGAVYHGEGIDYGHAAVRSHLDYFIRKLKKTGPLPVETRI